MPWRLQALLCPHPIFTSTFIFALFRFFFVWSPDIQKCDGIQAASTLYSNTLFWGVPKSVVECKRLLPRIPTHFVGESQKAWWNTSGFYPVFHSPRDVVPHTTYSKSKLFKRILIKHRCFFDPRPPGQPQHSKSILFKKISIQNRCFF